MSHVLVVCAKRFNGHELFTLLGVLQKRGHTFEVVSQNILIRDELTLRPNSLRRTVWDVWGSEVPSFDGICVVSGHLPDTEALWSDKHVELLLKDFKKQEKTIGAICCSVPTLVAKGAKVSYFPLIRARKRLEYYGADLQNTSLTSDPEARMVTAENQMMSEMWSEEVCNLLEGRAPQYIFKDSGFTPKGSERRMKPEIRAAIDEARGYKMVLTGPKYGYKGVHKKYSLK